MAEKISTQLEAEIISLYEKVKSCKGVARRLDTSSSTVLNVLRRNRVERRPNGFTAEQGQEMLRLRQAGWSDGAVARHFGCDISTVSRIIKRLQNPTPSRLHIPSSDEKVRMIALYEGGLNEEAVGKETGFCSITVRHVLRDADVERRTAGNYVRKYTLNEDFFALPITSEQVAYLLGFIATDGHCHHAGLSISLARRDKAHLEKLAAVMGYNGPVHEYERITGGKIYRKATLAISSTKMAQDLAALDLSGKKVYRVAPWDGPPELMRHYWRAAIDGDGSIKRRLMSADKRSRGLRKRLFRNHIGFVGTEAMVNGLADFIEQTIGWSPRIFPCKRCPSCYTLAVDSLRRVQELLSVLYDGATIWLDRKKNVADELLVAVYQNSGPAEDWSWLTAERLRELAAQHDSWEGLKQAVGKIGVMTLRAICHRHGVSTRYKRDWKWLTAEQLQQEFAERGSWGAVGRSLNIGKNVLVRQRKRLGLSICPISSNNWKHLTKESLTDLLQQHGTWKDVAAVLGIGKSVFFKVRRRLGLL